MPVDQARILMCPPDYYGIEYEINPWMNRSRRADRVRSHAQWLQLKEQLEAAGATIALLSPVEGLPDLVFTANAALIFQQQAVPARFRHPQRQGEQPYDEAWLLAEGFSIAPLPEGVFFEGAGDALFVGETLVAGYRMRSDARGLQQLAALLGCHLIPLELIDPYYYHLDTCFCPLSPSEAIYYPGAFDDYGLRVLTALVPKLIPVIREEAEQFACNAVVVGRTVMTNTGCPQLHQALQAAGYEPRATPLGEFVKAGGSAKEAGGWAQYFERYVACGEAEYLNRVGGMAAVGQLPLPVF